MLNLHQHCDKQVIQLFENTPYICYVLLTTKENVTLTSITLQYFVFRQLDEVSREFFRFRLPTFHRLHNINSITSNLKNFLVLHPQKLPSFLLPQMWPVVNKLKS